MTSSLSARGIHAKDSLKGETFVWEVTSNLWDPKTNPDGYVSLGVAENSLNHDELRDFLNSKALVDQASTAFTYGDGPTGSKLVRKALAGFFNDYFSPVQPVKPEHMMVTNGVSSAIEHVAWGLANPGDGILLGRPYYRAFLGDISTRTGVKVVPVSFGNTDLFSPECVQQYESALQNSNSSGIKIRALILCHPHNPLGQCYSKETLISIMRFCQKYQIHLISDEIYALSVFPNPTSTSTSNLTPFHSALSIPTSSIISPSLLHILWGTSKDFGANGIRLGVLLSQSNPDFLEACSTCALFSSPSSLAENAATHIFRDKTFMDNYIKLNKSRLAEAYGFATTLLSSYGIEYKSNVNAAFFLFVDLGKLYRSTHPEEASPQDQNRDKGDEHAITDRIFRRLVEYKVFIVSGDAAGAEEPGWFRVVFSQSREVVEEGIRRIVRALG